MNDKYDDIIDLPHYEPKNHPRMARIDRAAQFAPFAALTGYEELIKETARLTNKRKTLSDDEKEEINRTLNLLISKIKETPRVRVIYFKEDERKEGGEYVEYEGNLKKIEADSLIFSSKKKILLSDLSSISLD